MWVTINTALWISGWFVSAFMFLLQLIKIVRTKSSAGVSLWSNLGIGLLNINSVIYLCRFSDYISAFGAFIMLSTCLAIAFFSWYYEKSETLECREGYAIDLDGFLFDTQTPVHATAESRVLAKYGITVDPKEISYQYAGRSTKEVFKELAPDLDPEILLKEKWEIVREIITTTPPEPIEGMLGILQLFKANGAPMAIASASPRWYIEIFLEKSMESSTSSCHLLKEFVGSNYVSAEEVSRPKPAPDVFLEAARRIGVPHRLCTVMGDGKSDVLGGVAAGMKVLYLEIEPHDDDEIHDLHGVETFPDGLAMYEYVKKIYQ